MCCKLVALTNYRRILGGESDSESIPEPPGDFSEAPGGSGKLWESGSLLRILLKLKIDWVDFTILSHTTDQEDHQTEFETETARRSRNGRQKLTTDPDSLQTDETTTRVFFHVADCVSFSVFGHVHGNGYGADTSVRPSIRRFCRPVRLGLADLLRDLQSECLLVLTHTHAHIDRHTFMQGFHVHALSLLVETTAVYWLAV